MISFLTKILGDSNQRFLKGLGPIVDKINALEPQFEKFSDAQIPQKTLEFKERIKKGESLDSILPEAFALVREAAKRTIGERHFDVQVLGGIVLHQGKIAEMKTGEGKTLVATLPLYFNALTGKGCHLVTVNDYLARRDTNWMGPIYHLLGLTVGCINHEKSYIFDPRVKPDKDEVSIEYENLREVSRRQAYGSDITYGTNNEFGFDYLRDNMVWDSNQKVQRELNYTIVDEVDSILIDEARTPLIISAPDEESARLYQVFAGLVPRLRENIDYNIDHKMRAATISEAGIDKMEQWLGIGNIYEEGKTNYVHHLEQALKAQVLFKRDKDYVVKDAQVIIVDDFTGRLMYGRRYSEGLHQAIEAKEHVPVQKESRTLATITFQNYFRLYNKLAGMTGTAATSAEEFYKVYKLDVIMIPTNKPMIRMDLPDRIYKTERGKFKAVAQEIKARQAKGQPLLVGTIAIEKSELLSKMLSMEGIAHNVLNAKHHEKEAKIIAGAGQKGAVTIATNMAGRGTDIKLGSGVVEFGGLHIIGTERHEARRIDNQLRGRSGRQGDPGSSQFFVSMEDELMRVLGADRMKSLMDRLGVPEDQHIENPLISKSIESAQGKIEGINFDIRKHLLDYDDVMNRHREVIYKKRQEILEAANINMTPETGEIPLREKILDLVADEIEGIVVAHTGDIRSRWDTKEIFEAVGAIFPISQDTFEKISSMVKETRDDETVRNQIIDYLIDLAEKAYDEKEKEIGSDVLRQIEKAIYLRTIDMLWTQHLEAVEYFRTGVGLRGYGQRDPLVEYKNEAYRMFQRLLASIGGGVANTIYKISVRREAPPSPQALNVTATRPLVYQGADDTASSTAPFTKKKVGRNDPCPCGSGKKYKKCHGK